MLIVPSEIIEFETKTVTGDKEEHHIMIMRKGMFSPLIYK